MVATQYKQIVFSAVVALSIVGMGLSALAPRPAAASHFANPAASESVAGLRARGPAQVELWTKSMAGERNPGDLFSSGWSALQWECERDARSQGYARGVVRVVSERLYGAEYNIYETVGTCTAYRDRAPGP